jgi:hypothetical protein
MLNNIITFEVDLYLRRAALSRVTGDARTAETNERRAMAEYIAAWSEDKNNEKKSSYIEAEGEALKNDQ